MVMINPLLFGMSKSPLSLVLCLYFSLLEVIYIHETFHEKKGITLCFCLESFGSDISKRIHIKHKNHLVENETAGVISTNNFWFRCTLFQAQDSRYVFN